MSTIAEWVRRAIQHARRNTSSDVDRKLSAVQAAARHEFPAPEIEQMNEEIERGYREDRER